MKKTIKQWCTHYQIHWYSQGKIGDLNYDWKLVLGKGKTAIFSTQITDNLPKFKQIGQKERLIFPNINRSKNNGKISEVAFKNIIQWVSDALDGNIADYSEYHNRHI